MISILYTPELDETVCERLAAGEPLRVICRDIKVSYRTVYRWRKEHAAFAERFAECREIGEDVLAAECLEIANTIEIGEVIIEKADGGIEIRREDMLGHRKLKIETRLKLLAKYNPAKWGDKVENTHKVNGPVTLQLLGSDVHG